MRLTNEIYHYLYKRDKPFIVKLLAYILGLIALINLLNTPLYSVVMVVGSAGILTFYNGIELDFKNQTYRNINSVGTMGFGEWIPFPDFQYVSVFAVNLVSSVYGRSGASVTQKQGVFQVNLITKQNKRIRVLETENIEEAFQFAKEIAPKLNLKIWDATTKEANWLKLPNQSNIQLP